MQVPPPYHRIRLGPQLGSCSSLPAKQHRRYQWGNPLEKPLGQRERRFVLISQLIRLRVSVLPRCTAICMSLRLAGSLRHVSAHAELPYKLPAVVGRYMPQCFGDNVL